MTIGDWIMVSMVWAFCGWWAACWYTRLPDEETTKEGRSPTGIISQFIGGPIGLFCVVLMAFAADVSAHRKQVK